MVKLLKLAFSLSIIISLTAVMAAQNIESKKPAATGTLSNQGANQKASQEGETESTPAENALTPEQTHALWLLDSLFEQTKNFTDEKLKIRIQAEIASALWKYDEPRARRYFVDAFNAINTIKVVEKQRKPPFGAMDAILSSSTFQLRREVLRLISQHDPDLSKSLTKPTTDVSVNAPSAITLPGTQSEQSAQRPHLDLPIAETDSEHAARRARAPVAEDNVREMTREMLDKAEAARDLQQKDDFYRRAAMLAAREDVNQAIATAEKISDEQDRSLTKSIVRYGAALKALDKGEVDTAYNHAKGIEFPPQRVAMFNQMAKKLINKKETARATDTLDEITQWVNKLDNGPRKAKALLEIAETVINHDPNRGFEVMQSAVKAINAADFSSPLPTSSLLSNRNRVRAITVTLDHFNFKPSFSSLARADFNRALMLAQSLEKREASVMAQLALCQGVLSDSPKTQSAPGDENKAREDKRSSKEKQPAIKQKSVPDK